MNTTELALDAFIQDHVAHVSSLHKQGALAYFTATMSGKDTDYQEATATQIALEKIYANPADFAKIVSFRECKSILNPLLARQLEMLFLSYQGRQVEEQKLEEVVKMQTHIEEKFSTFRGEIEGKQLSDNEIQSILNSSSRSEEVQTTWLASKAIGPLVAPDIIKLVHMRNAIAQELGYKNYHEMSLSLDEQKPEEISALFDELDELTRDAFAQEKHQVDIFLSQKFNISVDQLMPWHYQDRFFQEAPKIYPVSLDSYYQDLDIVELSRNYYASIGLGVDDILAHSDLYERPGKYQHAYCIDIDKQGDIRIVCNIKSNSSRMSTQLHELGHAVYDKYLDPQTPYLLRDPAHTFTTEAIAMLFGRFASNPQRIHDCIGISEPEKEKIADSCFRTLRLEQLVFSRWAQVMYRFEKGMYEHPDQDLNALWWDLVESYQMIRRPEGRDAPDWATKIHIASVPCYYHNYLLGELLASQLYHYMTCTILQSTDEKNQSFFGKKEIGDYLRKNVFAHGRMYHWNTMIEKATGENLTPKYYAKQFVE